MLFLNQIKREFSLADWNRGLIYFREERVTHVKLAGSFVSARVKDSNSSVYDTSITMSQGTISKALCACGTSADKKRCKHVAALGIWLTRRGSLLRAGILEKGSEGKEDVIKEKPVVAVRNPSEFVAWIRGIFQEGKFIGLSVEPALRYLDPDTSKSKVEAISHLIRDSEPNTWRTPRGTYLQLTSDPVPVASLEGVHSAKIFHQGQTGLDQLAVLLALESHKRMVFHESVAMELESSPLKLESLSIGKKSLQGRTLTYEFKNEKGAKFSSSELAEFNGKGLLSNRHLWKGKTIFRLEPTLDTLSRFANRSGVSSPEDEGIPELADGFGVLDDNEKNPLHPITAYRLSLELGVHAFRVDLDWKEFHDWKKTFERKRMPQLPKVEYGFELRDYQINGLSWLWSLYHRGLAALLADDMGLGKTHQVLAFLTSIYATRDRPKLPTLVVAPTSVVAAWSQKLQRYPTGLRWHVFHGQRRNLPETNLDLVLTTYGILQREEALREREWHVIILDEAQAIKNSSTISSRASRALKSQYRIAMTGTPVENHAMDLWSVMEFLLPGYMGSLPRFKRLYGAERDGTSREQAQALKRLISPFLLRRTKSQVLKELPEKTEDMVSCEMTVEQKKVYRAYLSGAEAERVRQNLQSPGKVDYANVLALLTRLKQVCNHPRLPELTAGKIKRVGKVDPFESGKWEPFEEIINEAMGSNLKVVVFTQYLGMISMIGEFLKTRNIGYTELRGDTPDREKRLQKFADEPDCRVFLCSLLAGGLGIDLTSASVCVHFDRWWNPAKENQATDRLHRFGQTRGVQVFKLQVPGTIEDRIAAIINSKRQLSDALIEESPVGLRSFSRAELLQILTPS